MRAARLFSACKPWFRETHRQTQMIAGFGIDRIRHLESIRSKDRRDLSMIPRSWNPFPDKNMLKQGDNRWIRFNAVGSDRSRIKP
jgi:hypothetical protein